MFQQKQTRARIDSTQTTVAPATFLIQRQVPNSILMKCGRVVIVEQLVPRTTSIQWERHKRISPTAEEGFDVGKAMDEFPKLLAGSLNRSVNIVDHRE